VIKLHEAKRTFVGRFAEEMLREIIGGELTRDEFGDLCIWDRERTVEIKSSSVPSSYGFRLSVEQINNGRRARNFPFQSVWYALFAYSNPNKVGEDGKKHTAMSPHKKEGDVRNFLAKSLRWCVIADLSIVERWEEKLPHSTKSLVGRGQGEETVDVKTRYLEHLSNGGLKSGLTELDLNPKGYSVLSGKIEAEFRLDLFDEYKISVPLTAIILSDEARLFERDMRERGWDFKRRGL
jgi:hypothetical protein